jgi:hypothetical protein
MNFGSGIHRYPGKFFVATCDLSIKTRMSSEAPDKALALLEEN